MNHLTIFDELYPKFKITKPIRLIEFFAGYGSQALALKYLGVKFEHWKICEWAIKSIQAYKDIHTEDNNDYSKDLTKEELQEWLFNKGISSNYNEPMTKEQINRLGEDSLRTIYNNIKATHNLVNIQQVKSTNLEITDKDKYDYILTYSFPCQDLSLAGKGKGMSDTSTRSGMLWEVERILKELKETDSLPQVLLMENVPMVHSVDNTPDFNKWQIELTKLGYKNYWEDLIATDYGIPQTRNRCFMVSILGDYNYTFPKPIPLEKKLKDMLEDNVDEKYYISDDLMKHIQKTAEEHTEYTQYERYNGEFEQLARVWKEKSPTLHTKSNEIKIYVKNATKKGYLEATDGDEVDISSRMEHHRGTVQKGKAQTLTTMGGENNGVVIGTYQYSKSDSFMQGKDRLQLGKETSDTLQTTPKEGIVNSDLRIRKLTPKECFRLMGVKDEDFEKVKVNQSDSSLYHLAGDSIVVNILMAIFKEMI
jgi:DNA (cytosine-5)-methyltransferase 1